ncbi:CRISPR-associated helicase Cas3' [Microbacterium sp. BWT-B31]|uniref:CRISPR-associated helicase Cas3' n=1 Tax=Microbacterium sp. BWT-B31 TaxID=3232072 RepID=UPI0035273220
MRATFIEDRSLSPAARAVWAKTRTDPTQKPPLIGWLPLYQHLDDAAGVARLLWEEWAPRSVKETIGRCVGSEDAARDLVTWLAGVHDIGKASPAFAVQVESLAEDMRVAGLRCDPRIKDDDERGRTRHELVGFLAVREWLMSEHLFDPDAAQALASVVASHHGRPATAAEVRSAEPRSHLIGEGSWADVRRELLSAADAAFASRASHAHWRSAILTQPALVLLSALVIVADWIASSDLLDAAELGAWPTHTTPDRVRGAWQALDFPRPWAAAPSNTDAATLLAERFTLPDGAIPHATQTALVEMALRTEAPELMVLESEMGSGKTEAALLAAEIVASRFGLSGIFVGLPTQATADGMFSRVLEWGERLGLDVPASVFLARGRASQNRDYEQKTRKAHFRSIGDEHSSHREASEDSMLVAHRWFAAPRRGPLSNFVVGTVDQALFAGLRSRYVMLRHLALASKVVIIDEVHAYDVYMRQYLLRVIEWLGAYGVPVILLSATLPSGQREEFIRAYDRGREATGLADERAEEDESDYQALLDRRRHARERRAAVDAQRYGALHDVVDYPSIVRSSVTGPAEILAPGGAGVSRVLRVDRLPDDTDALTGMLRSALRDGGCAAVICNTVRRAQERAAALREAFAGDDVQITLAHSRFLGVDRAAKDRSLLDAYGPKGTRPPRSIIVATQVIEQSLDIDFDLMVTDVAPIDLLLQRSGRLHRHAWRERPAPLREPRLFLTGVDRDGASPVFDKGTLAVYSEAILLRTMAALEGRGSIALPNDIRPLVELVYSDDTDYVPPSWRDALVEAARNHRSIEQKKTEGARAGLLQPVRGEDPTLIGWISAPDADPELTPPGRATVRDTDETLEVIVLQRDMDGTFLLPVWVPEGGQQIPANEPPNSRLTRAILGCVLRLPPGMCRGNAIDRHIAALERSFDLPSWHGSYALKGELVLAFDMDGRARLNEFDLRYSPADGLLYERRTV